MPKAETLAAAKQAGDSAGRPRQAGVVVLAGPAFKRPIAKLPASAVGSDGRRLVSEHAHGRAGGGGVNSSIASFAGSPPTIAI